MVKKIKLLLTNLLWILPFAAFLAGYWILNLCYTVNRVPTPNLVGKSLSDAAKITSYANLNLRVISTQVEQDLAPDTILSQTPNHPTIKPNQTIFVVISQKPATSLAPDLYNCDKATAQKQLETDGIKAKFYGLPSTAPQGHCFAQSPSPRGELPNQGLTIYYSALKPEPIIMPNLIGLNLSEVKSFLTANQIQIKISHVVDSHHAPDLIIDQSPIAGTVLELEKIKQVHLQVTKN